MWRGVCRGDVFPKTVDWDDCQVSSDEVGCRCMVLDEAVLSFNVVVLVVVCGCGACLYMCVIVSSRKCGCLSVLSFPLVGVCGHAILV